MEPGPYGGVDPCSPSAVGPGSTGPDCPRRQLRCAGAGASGRSGRRRPCARSRRPCRRRRRRPHAPSGAASRRFPRARAPAAGPSARTLGPIDSNSSSGTSTVSISALGEQLEQPHRREPRVDEREIAVERRDVRHQVQHLAGAVPVRQVERRSRRRRETRRQRGDPGHARAIAVTDEQRLVVEPERVAALDAGRRLDP